MKTSASLASLALAVLLLLRAVPSRAASSTATAPVPHGSVTLLTETPTIEPHGDSWLAFHFVIEPGWHLYWSNPGDSGEPPRLAWHLPAGLSAGAIAWPAPKRLPAPGVMDFGYTDDAVLLVPLRSAGGLVPGTAANLGVEIKLVICRELCIPGRAQLSLSVPVGASLAGAGRPVPQTANLFAAARSHLPKPSPPAWKIHVEQSKDQVLLDVDTGRSTSVVSFFPLEEDQIDNAAPQPIEPTQKGFRMRLRKSDQLLHPLERLRGVLEMDGAAYTLDSHLSASAPVKKSPAGNHS